MARITWTDLPAWLRERVEDTLGSSVVSFTSQPGGYSPGTADRVVCADGTRGFVKAVSLAHNPDSPQIYRMEARVLERLPAGVPVPRLRAWWDEGDWVCLLIEDVEARHPALPWRADEATHVLDTLTTLGRDLTPSPVADLPEAVAHVGPMTTAWERWAACEEEVPDDLDPWLRERLPDLADRSARCVAALPGDTLTHFDLRADNLLLGDDGHVWVIDWPWAMNAASWVDPTLLAIEFATSWVEDASSTHPDVWLRRIASDHGVGTEPLVDLLIGMAAFFESHGRTPSVPGLPTLRAFQRYQGAALVTWLKQTGLP